MPSVTETSKLTQTKKILHLNRDYETETRKLSNFMEACSIRTPGGLNKNLVANPFTANTQVD